MTPGLALFFVGICLLTEGFFSGSETALVSADRLKLRAKAEEGDSGALLALSMLNRPAFLVGTCLVGTNLSLVLNSTLVSQVLFTGQSHGLGYELLVALPTLLIGEMIPKSVYQAHANRLATVVVYPLRVASFVFSPLLMLLEGLSLLLFRLFRIEQSDQKVSREEIKMVLQSGGRMSIDQEDQALIQGVFEFSEARVDEVMVPLVEMVMVESSRNVRDAVALIETHGYSWVPVYAERVDNLVGVLHHSDLLLARDLDQPLEGLMRPVPFVPDSKSVRDLFGELRQKGQRIAMVVDEYGGAVGMVTLEDLLEQVVGDIEDEYDDDDQALRQEGEGRWWLSARLDVSALSERTGITLPMGEYETVAGLMLARLGRVPQPGEKVSGEGWTLEAVKVTERAILEVRLIAPRR